MDKQNKKKRAKEEKENKFNRKIHTNKLKKNVISEYVSGGADTHVDRISRKAIERANIT